MDDNRCLDPGSAEDGVENINISDVIEVIETDLDSSQASPPRPSNMFAVPRPLDPAQIRNQAWVEVIEQPAHKALRFRYECEGRSAGSIPGESSSTENKTFPAIRVVGYRGKAVVVVSCVTRDKPYRAHPHNLVGREGCRKGVCTLEIPPETMTMTFSNLGIQCVKKKDIEAHLKVREEIRVDPFKSGFAHRNQPTSIDLNSVRLCFQVFLENEKTKKFTVALEPVVSNPIYDKKAIADLVIVKLSDCSCSVDGGRKDVVLLCEKVAKEDIQVRFFEEKNGAVTWEGLGDFQPSQVHKQHAIWFRPPRYHTLDITEPVKVNIQLRRPSDGATSEALPFEYLPLDSGVKRKRKFEPSSAMLRPLPDNASRPDTKDAFHMLNNISPVNVKTEPQETAPYVSPSYTGALSPMYPSASISPHYMQHPYPNMSPQTITYPPNNNLNITQNNVLPSIGTWNIASTSGLNTINLTGVNTNNNNLNNAMSIELLDLDNQNTELHQLNLNSDELSYMLSENLSNNLSLTDVPNTDITTDSLTRLTDNAYNKLCNNNKYE